MRKYIKDEMAKIRADVKELRTMGTSDAVVLSEQFGRLPKTSRKAAIARFYRNFGKPDLSDPVDLETLIDLSKQ